MRVLAFISLIVCAHGQTLQLDRWKAAAVDPLHAFEARQIASRIVANRARYYAVAQMAMVPWHVIAALHNMESGGSFRHHLHEGSPLAGRTRYVPKGRPVAGSPPFRWEISAADALAYDHMAAVYWRSLDCALYACERYNGTGYLRNHAETPTPYLWAGTSIERPGKYVADGKWSSTARSSQIGIAALWKELEARGVLNLPKP
ncbi:MAG: peptidoglycan-binding protein [Verrucomicrobiota bacterium]